MSKWMEQLECVKQQTWLKVIAGSAITLVFLSFVEFIMSRFNVGTMELMMKSMRGMFLSMFLRDILNVAIQSMIFFLLLGVGLGMVLYFKRILQKI